MKITYENCRVKNYTKEDHRSYRRNFCSCEKKAWKNSGLYGIRTAWPLRYRCSAVTIQQANWEQVVELVESLVNKFLVRLLLIDQVSDTPSSGKWLFSPSILFPIYLVLQWSEAVFVRFSRARNPLPLSFQTPPTQIHARNLNTTARETSVSIDQTATGLTRNCK